MIFVPHIFLSTAEVAVMCARVDEKFNSLFPLTDGDDPCPAPQQSVIEGAAVA